MGKDNKIRAGNYFMQITNSLRKEIEPSIGRKLSNRELTDSIGSFLDKEDLLPHMVKRAKRKNRGGLF